MTYIYKLFLDDVRFPTSIYPTCKNHDWVIVRNYDSFVDTITRNGLPFLVSFDHDLGPLAYNAYAESVKTGVHTYNNVERTGLDCAKWLIEYCMDKKRTLPAWKVHSANPIGAENIVSLLEQFQHFQGKTDK